MIYELYNITPDQLHAKYLYISNNVNWCTDVCMQNIQEGQ